MNDEAFNDLYFAVTRVLTRGSEALPELEAAHVRATAHRREAAGVARVVPARPLDDVKRVSKDIPAEWVASWQEQLDLAHRMLDEAGVKLRTEDGTDLSLPERLSLVLAWPLDDTERENR